TPKGWGVKCRLPLRRPHPVRRWWHQVSVGWFADWLASEHSEDSLSSEAGFDPEQLAMSGKNILYAQSGGVTPVINATAAAVIERARASGGRVGRVLAARDGIIGALEERLIDTAQLGEPELAALNHTPGGVFGSCRYKLRSIDENQREYERLIEVFRAHDIGTFLYNGGNDSADTAWKISQIGDRLGFPVQCIGIPKTIDNDLMVTD